MKLISPKTKKTIETNLNTFSNNNKEKFFLLSDLLKEFGFTFAKHSGISIGLNDINGLILKKKYFFSKDIELKKIATLWSQGIISKNEYFKLSLNLWNSLFNYLKEIIAPVYTKNLFFSSLNLMIMSGARGNWAQLFQLSEFRGILLDQEGKLLEIPVHTNFKQGLNLLDYSISFYSSRKGIIDTALKTAVAGYLTRRLVFLAQDSILKIKDCLTPIKITVLKPKNSFNLLKSKLQVNKTNFYRKFGLRNVLTCNVNFNACQKCYGLEIHNKALASLGSAIGVIAAHSLSEPTTQMTLKTFHSGGMASIGAQNDNSLIKNSGKIIFPKMLLGSVTSDINGIFNFNLHKKYRFNTVTWTGRKFIGSLLKNDTLTTKKIFIKNKFFHESENLKGDISNKIFQPLFSTVTGEVNFKLANLKKEKFLSSSNSLIKTTIFENSLIEIKQSDSLIEDVNIANSFFKSSFANYYFNKVKTIITTTNFNEINNEFLKIQYNDTLTSVKMLNKNFNVSNRSINKKFQKKNLLFSILLNNNNLIRNNNNFLKINSNSFLGVEPGSCIKSNNLIGYSSTMNNRDEDIVNAISQINLVLTNSKSFGHYKLFSPFFATSQYFVINNLIQKIFNVNHLLETIFLYQEKKDGNLKGLKIALIKFSLIICNSIAAIYSAQEANVSLRHIDLIVKRLISFSFLKKNLIKREDCYHFNTTILIQVRKLSNKYINKNLLIAQTSSNLFNEFVNNLKSQSSTIFTHLTWINQKIQKDFGKHFNHFELLKVTPLTFKKLQALKRSFKVPLAFKPTFLSETMFVDIVSQFLLKSTFQKGKSTLAKSALYGKNTWFDGLRENIITGGLSPTGSNIYFLKNSFTAHYSFKAK